MGSWLPLTLCSHSGQELTLKSSYFHTTLPPVWEPGGGCASGPVPFPFVSPVPRPKCSWLFQLSILPLSKQLSEVPEFPKIPSFSSTFHTTDLVCEVEIYIGMYIPCPCYFNILCYCGITSYRNTCSGKFLAQDLSSRPSGMLDSNRCGHGRVFTYNVCGIRLQLAPSIPNNITQSQTSYVLHNNQLYQMLPMQSMLYAGVDMDEEDDEEEEPYDRSRSPSPPPSLFQEALVK